MDKMDKNGNFMTVAHFFFIFESDHFSKVWPGRSLQAAMGRKSVVRHASM